jgi:hypothetical protein
MRDVVMSTLTLGSSELVSVNKIEIIIENELNE